MGKDSNFHDMNERRLRLTMHTAGPAKVISFDEVNLRADIELLFLMRYADGDTQPYPIIEDVPIVWQRFKIRESYPATVSGLKSIEGDVSSSATIFPGKEVEYYPDLKPGDVVWVNFAERAMDNFDGPNKFDPEYNRTHDIRDAVIIGLL